MKGEYILSLLKISYTLCMWNFSKNTDYTKERLFSYALWYSGKYRVSRTRIQEKLRWKTSNAWDIDSVLDQILPYHSDITEIHSYIESYLAKSKSLQYVKHSLRKKKFQISDIESALWDFGEFDVYDNFEKNIETRIFNLIEKGNWPRAIQHDLIQKYPQFAERIQARCKDFDESELLETGPYSKLLSWAWVSRAPKDIKKIQDTLLRKGFSYTSVQIFLKKIPNPPTSLELEWFSTMQE